MLLARLRIRGKLALLVVIPLLSIVGLAVPAVLDRVAAAQRAGDIAERVRVASRIGTLVQDLQQERVLSVGLLLGRVTRTELVQRTASVDDRVADLRATRGDRLQPRVAEALSRVRGLTDLRAAVLAGTATPDQIMAAYGPVNAALIESLRLPFGVDTETAAGRQVLALDGLLRADEGLAACATLIVLVKATGEPRVSASFVACMAALRVDNQRFRSLITPEQFALARLNDAAVAARTNATFLTTSVLDPAGATRDIPLDALFPAVRSMITFGQFIEKKLVADVIAEVTRQQRRALTEAHLVGGLATLILVGVVLLSVAVARTVARPLTRLTRSADRVARVAEAELTRVADDETEGAAPVRLDPVDVRARDEIGDLARAFDRVQSTAARLVERQVAGRRNVAQMFGHVGRRTQNLVGRQIALIDRLERQETDPGRLEHLYRLDHISSRLRRNAGSLVVLSGSAGADPHVAPVPLGDVVRLALGEIEDYTRVDVRVPPGVSVAPGTVGDLVLALAELMENATVFSPPHTRVTVDGEQAGSGARLTVIDRGIGMTQERLAEENARLTRRERLDLAPTELLGLFVVGRLARRHGWAVRLAPTAGGGVTAHLEVPETSLVIHRAERTGVTVARAAVPARDRRSTADAPAAARPHAPAVATPEVTGPAPARAHAATVAAPEAARPRAAAVEAPEVARPHAAAVEAPEVARPHAAAVEAPEVARPHAAVGAAPQAPPAGFDAALLSRVTRSMESGASWDAFGSGDEPEAPTGAAPTGIRQRVPGATLRPAEPPAVGPAQATGVDPAAARALVEAVESGVRRAEVGRRTPDGTVPGRLTRRVPGANLTATPARQPDSPHLGNPDEVRDLLTEFEAGVARALREVSQDHRYEEGTSR
ncbi:nitrate- and nitrite sensing domain-containing protein [Micromonospora sp. C31]|uniref:nitrate- and nitrite sensing domain-containing protein n=1 Tax=Micromonospora sp. C31 TaxID=2824876 RepID=UPI001B38F802|nr:nitrate- and nitrite sensing domain-containing protein [Micromonospora sp. C31]MBQ1072319.1 nitrate- and nitrite sensing domain-containing protein [Micromonospora sp. C31]